jgi:uncharacterized membrane protein YfcA
MPSCFAGYLDQIVVDWAFMLAFTACAVVGIIAGSWRPRIPARSLRRRSPCSCC